VEKYILPGLSNFGFWFFGASVLSFCPKRSTCAREESHDMFFSMDVSLSSFFFMHISHNWFLTSVHHISFHQNMEIDACKSRSHSHPRLCPSLYVLLNKPFCGLSLSLSLSLFLSLSLSLVFFSKCMRMHYFAIHVCACVSKWVCVFLCMFICLCTFCVEFSRGKVTEHVFSVKVTSLMYVCSLCVRVFLMCTHVHTCE
jgi:hypothetical protein